MKHCYLSILSLNGNGLQSKDIDWWIVFKGKIQPFLAYKKHTLLAKTNTGLE
jgi:hypothetical protein